jgi:GT2 family glycosyltransferase/tetratricopeptide (TPR) repeat protein/glycosyltransferase involved in cell wall biosynthesis
MSHTPSPADQTTRLDAPADATAEEIGKLIEQACRQSDQVHLTLPLGAPPNPGSPQDPSCELWRNLFARHEFYPDLRFQSGSSAPSMLFRKLDKSLLHVGVFSHEEPSGAIALIRLTGMIGLMEKQGRMKLHHISILQTEINVEEFLDCDVFVIHREFADKKVCRPIIRAARELGKVIIYELDDLLFDIPKSNPNHPYSDYITPDLLEMVDEADIITVTTERLRAEIEARRPGAAARTYVLPNFTNLEFWGGAEAPAENASGPLIIGWCGTNTHEEDLAILKPAIAKIARKYRGKVVFRFWGYLPDDLKGIEGVELVRGSVPDLRMHAREMAKTRIDLGLAPLVDHPFNHAKSNMKWLDYSICHVPAIFSAITPYSNSVVHGETGWLVENTADAWTDAMDRLISDTALRRKIARRAYEEVRGKHCLQDNALRWDSLYRSLYVSGPRAGQAAETNDPAARTRAAASLMMFQGDAFWRLFKNKEAASSYEQSLNKLLETASNLQEPVWTLFAKFQRALSDLNLSNTVRVLVNQGRSLVTSGHTEAAIRVFIDSIKAAEKTKHPILIYETLVEAGKEMVPLHPTRSREVFQLAEQLAIKLSLPNEAKVARDLLASVPASSERPAVGAKAVPTAKPASPKAQPVQPAPVIDPLVSVIIPVFNRVDLTRQCLRALFANTSAPRFEVIIVDNGSNDGTSELIRAEEIEGRIRSINNGENIGFARACNKGAAAAKGRYLVFLNNDTEVQPNWLGSLFTLAENDPAIAAVGSKLLYPDGTIQHAGVALADCWDHDPLLAFHLFAKEKSAFPLANQRRVYQALTAASLLVRKSCFEEVGGFDEEYWNGYEDVDLCLKFQQKKWLSVYEPASVVIHHESQSGPERFRCVAQNVQRFHGKWLEKASPDVIIDREGKNRMTPNSVTRLYAPPPRKLVSIIILAHNQLKDTQQCLSSIEKNTPENHELILVDNGSSDGTTEFFRSYAAKHNHVRIILNKENLGFAAGNNQGLALARGENILLLNNDTVVTPGWLERMLAALDLHPECGAVGPVSNSVSGPQLVSTASYSSLEQLPKFSTLWCNSHAGQSTEAPRLVGFCLLMRRAVVERIGGLDPQFGNGNFEDDDLCIRAGLSGFKLRIVQDSFVHHTGGQTFKGAKIDYRASMLKNWGLFKTKWGMPANTMLEQGYRLPTAAPQGLSLQQALPDLDATHTSSLEGRCRTDKALSETESKKTARTPGAIALPPCALIGHLGEARQLVQNKQWPAAWKSALAAIAARPYHPEAYLLLAEIALSAGDGLTAAFCARHARRLAPEWKAAKKFLNRKLAGQAKPNWLALPEALGQPRRPELTVCLIVRNEERFLGKCLASVRGLANQIVVLDTGSTDKTVEIAKEHGAEVYCADWTDDFSAARNTALNYARGDWILSLDADEELSPNQAENLACEMEAPEVMAYRLPIINQGRESEGCSYVPRLFRNAPGIFFVGRVHEQAFSSIQVRCQEWGLNHQLGKTALLHHGYSSEIVQSRHKVERNLRLLNLAIEELPGEPNLVMSLGAELIRSGEREAGLRHYKEAFELLSQMPAGKVMPELRETFLTQFSTELLAAKDFAQLADLAGKPLVKSGPVPASLHFNFGLAFMELKQFDMAAEHMRQCLETRDQPALSPVHAGILKGAPHHCLALCQTALKQYAEALASFQAGLVEDPDSRPLRMDFVRFLVERGHPVQALEQVNAMREKNPADVEVWQLGGQIALSQPQFLDFAKDWTGEALKSFPTDSRFKLSHAEVLLLRQEVDAARALWSEAHSPVSARDVAAMTLMELVEGDCQRQFSSADEPRVSQEFLKWYRQLLRFGARKTILDLDERIETVRLTLPTFANAWDAAHKKAREAVAA